MRVGKVLAISVVSIAGVIVLSAAVIAIRFLVPSRSDSQQNFAPHEGQQAVSPTAEVVLLSQASGSSSFFYLKASANGAKQRLSSASSGIESEASFSHDGKLVVYCFAPSAESKSSVWLVGVDGKNPHPITEADEDALHPVFSPDDSRVFYAASSFTGNHSPIVRPARHDWEVFSIPIQAAGAIAGAARTQVTHASLYDLQSLDVVADGLNPGGTKVLVSTTGYPIGALLQELNLGATGRDKMFQPHVPGESSVGPAFGEARYIHDGMDVLFLAATNNAGGNYDYNVYSMSDVTGGEIKQLTHFRGMSAQLKLLPDGIATFENGGTLYRLDVSAQTVKPF